MWKMIYFCSKHLLLNGLLQKEHIKSGMSFFNIKLTNNLFANII